MIPRWLGIVIVLASWTAFAFGVGWYSAWRVWMRR